MQRNLFLILITSYLLIGACSFILPPFINEVLDKARKQETPETNTNYVFVIPMDQNGILIGFDITGYKFPVQKFNVITFIVGDLDVIDNKIYYYCENVTNCGIISSGSGNHIFYKRDDNFL